MDEVKLIQSVRSHECLWKSSSKSYKDSKSREEAWNSVTAEMGETSLEDCTRKWKNLRDQFVKQLKKEGKVGKRKRGATNEPYISKWRHFETMKFLTDSVRPKETAIEDSDSPVEEQKINEFSKENGYGIESSTHINDKSPARASQSASPVQLYEDKKRKLEDYFDVIQCHVNFLAQQIGSRSADASNPERYFGMEVAERLNNMSCKSKAMAKLRIQEVLYDIEFSAEKSS